LGLGLGQIRDFDSSRRKSKSSKKTLKLAVVALLAYQSAVLPNYVVGTLILFYFIAIGVDRGRGDVKGDFPCSLGYRLDKGTLAPLQVFSNFLGKKSHHGSSQKARLQLFDCVKYFGARQWPWQNNLYSAFSWNL